MIKLGIVGSSSDLSENEIQVARKLGEKLSEINNLEFFICFDEVSLPVEAAKEILRNGGNVTCFTSDSKEEDEAKKIGFSTINLNLPRLNREIVFVRDIDVLLVCGGGSGTLMEVTFAYQMNKPIFLLEEIEGSVSVFRDKYLDKRERIKTKSVSLNEIANILGEC